MPTYSPTTNRPTSLSPTMTPTTNTPTTATPTTTEPTTAEPTVSSTTRAPVTTSPTTAFPTTTYPSHSPTKTPTSPPSTETPTSISTQYSTSEETEYVSTDSEESTSTYQTFGDPAAATVKGMAPTLYLLYIAIPVTLCLICGLCIFWYCTYKRRRREKQIKSEAQLTTTQKFKILSMRDITAHHIPDRNSPISPITPIP
eukprot:57985_1